MKGAISWPAACGTSDRRDCSISEVARAPQQIAGGALGNMLDRFRIGSVIDFVHVSYKAWSFAVFNFADAAITIGVMAVLASIYLETPRACPDGQEQ
jgi:lipoprotein signal peptidase